MKDEKCLRCQGGGETALVFSILFMLVAAPIVGALILWRFTRARALTLRIYRRVFDIGRFKVVRGLACYFCGLFASAGGNELPLLLVRGVGELPNYGYRGLGLADNFPRAFQVIAL